MEKSLLKLQEKLKSFKRSRFSQSSLEISKKITKQKIVSQERINLLTRDYLIINEKKTLKKRVLSDILKHLSWVSSQISKNSAKIKSKNVEIRDQGFTKPKVLIITPLKSTAYSIIQDLISIYSKQSESSPEIRFRSRFEEEYSAPEEPLKGDKPRDFEEVFGGNNDDCFRMGIKFSKKVIGLYSNFYASDLIVGSPLGLRMAASSKDDLNFDFLSGIEILLVDHSEILLMQNWEHALLIFNNLNLIPKVDHGADFSRIRDWVLDGYSKYMRQTIILSKYATPELTNLMNNHCFNIEGKYYSLKIRKSSKCSEF